MKNVICYNCDTSGAYYTSDKTIFHGRGKCVVCGKTRNGFIAQEKAHRPSDEDDEGCRYCPHCDAKIEHLNYRLTGCEYGSCSLDEEDYEADGFDSDGGEMMHSCPECGEDVSSNELLVSCPGGNEDEDKNSETSNKTDERPLTE